MQWCMPMSENRFIFSCGHKKPIFLITFSVAGEEKTYSVCKSCEVLEYFKKFVIKKVSINSSIIDNAQRSDATTGGLDN